jgi:hypothetical protein
MARQFLVISWAFWAESAISFRGQLPSECVIGCIGSVRYPGFIPNFPEVNSGFKNCDPIKYLICQVQVKQARASGQTGTGLGFYAHYDSIVFHFISHR